MANSQYNSRYGTRNYGRGFRNYSPKTTPEGHRLFPVSGNTGKDAADWMLLNAANKSVKAQIEADHTTELLGGRIGKIVAVGQRITFSSDSGQTLPVWNVTDAHVGFSEDGAYMGFIGKAGLNRSMRLSDSAVMPVLGATYEASTRLTIREVPKSQEPTREELELHASRVSEQDAMRANRAASRAEVNQLLAQSEEMSSFTGGKIVVKAAQLCDVDYYDDNETDENMQKKTRRCVIVFIDQFVSESGSPIGESAVQHSMSRSTGSEEEPGEGSPETDAPAVEEGQEPETEDAPKGRTRRTPRLSVEG